VKKLCLVALLLLFIFALTACAGESDLPQLAEGPEESPAQMMPEEIRELLNNSPHPGVDLRMREQRPQPVVDSERGREIAQFIDAMHAWPSRLPTTSFRSPQEIDNTFAVSAAIMATPPIQWGWPEGAGYRPELSVLEPYLSLTFGPWPPHHLGIAHRHVEETARQLFGASVTISPTYEVVEHSQAGFVYFSEFMGEYFYRVTFGMDLRVGRHLTVISYTEIEGGYEVACAFLWQIWRDGELFYHNELNITGDGGVAESELPAYLQSTAQVHTITLLRNEAGGFYYHAHILPE